MKLANDINIVLIAVFFVCFIVVSILYIINWILGLFKSNEVIKTIHKYIVEFLCMLSIVMIAIMLLYIWFNLICFIIG